MTIMAFNLFKDLMLMMKKINKKLKYLPGSENMMKQKRFIEQLIEKI